MITENYEKYMDKRWNENHKTMTAKDCERILQTMAVGACRTEKEAIEYAIKQMKKAKKAKRWKRKYLELTSMLDKRSCDKCKYGRTEYLQQACKECEEHGNFVPKWKADTLIYDEFCGLNDKD